MGPSDLDLLGGTSLCEGRVGGGLLNVLRAMHFCTVYVFRTGLLGCNSIYSITRVAPTEV